jgi:deoxyribose-phosphate aldolase
MTSNYDYESIAKMIDHSLLNPALSTRELEEGCALAVRYNVASVCILPYYLARCAEILAGTTVQASTTIGFPHGGQRTEIKVAEARQALKDGGQELDVVINISKARSEDWRYIQDELLALTQTIHADAAKIKVIFENAYLDDAAKIRLCEICGTIGVDWVKTSTGYAASGATLADLTLMRKHSPERVQVKAAGGIRDLDALLEVRAIGVSRVGATRTESMLEECRKRLGLEPISPGALVVAQAPAGY